MSVPLKINEEGGRKREFIFVEKQEVNRTRETNIKTLPGTRKLHCVRSTEMENHLDVRMLSCYCQECKAGDRDANQQSQCTNRQYASPFERKILQRSGQVDEPSILFTKNIRLKYLIYQNRK